MEFQDKDRALDSVRRSINIDLEGLHPVDKVDVCHTIEKEAGEAATRQAEMNDRDGVPERPEDREKTASINDRMDGSR